MSTGPINGLSSYLQSIFSSAVQGGGLKTGTTNHRLSGIDPSSISLQPDSNQLSPFAQVLSTLQQLQQTDPAKYQQVTQQIAVNLQNAAQTATSAGNTAAASQLNQLSTDFSNASKSGQLPNIQDLAQAVGGHHHHHHAHYTSADSDADSSSQLQSASQTNGCQSAAVNPMSIIVSTLSTAGSAGSNGQ